MKLKVSIKSSVKAKFLAYSFYTISSVLDVRVF